ncbi:MAG: 2Fe-2S iron-sulfur cluster-binding protein [Myxococcota bacterium]
MNAAITVHTADGVQTITAAAGQTLRAALLDAGLTPYGRWTHTLNCGGRGICATCGVWIEDAPAPTHWHDKAADAYGYPRLSCQIAVQDGMIVHLIPDKIAWGKLWPDLGGTRKEER